MAEESKEIQAEVQTEKKEKEKKEIKWSYSRVDCYKGCHFKYKLKYEDGNYPPPDSAALEFGTAVHHAEETIANFIKDAQPINYNQVKNRFIIDCAKIDTKYGDWFTPDNDTGKTYEEKKYYYLESGIYRLEKYMNEHPNLKIVGAEVGIDFYYKDLEDKHFTGSIDRLLYDTEKESYIIQDIKTWPIMEPKHNDEKNTPVQLAIYSVALAKEKGIDPYSIKCQYDLPLVNEIFDAGTEDYIERATGIVDKAFGGIAIADWHPTASALCAYCPFSATNPNASPKFKFLCPYHSIWDRELRLPKTAAAPFLAWKGINNHEHTMEVYKGLLKVKKGSE